MRTPGAPPITKTTAQAHPKNIETPHQHSCAPSRPPGAWR
jgi:hypothetical protein